MGIGFVTLYFLLAPESSANAETDTSMTADFDKDGVINKSDIEDSTVWLSDTSVYKLSKFIAADGTLDRIKVDSLCNCFAVPDSAERAKIKCKDNADYFVFEGKLWHYDDATNSFYDKDKNKVKSWVNAITMHHDDLIKVNSKSEGNKSNGTTEVTFKNVKYYVSEKLISSVGVVYNDADYRYFNGKWERRNNSGSGSWNAAPDSDINYLLSIIGTKVSTATKQTTEKNEIGEKAEEPYDDSAKDNSDTGNAADNFYLGYCKDGDPNKLFKDVIRNERVKIENYKGSPETCNGKKARHNIYKYLKNY